MPTGKYRKLTVFHNPVECNKVREMAMQKTSTVTPKMRLLNAWSRLVSNKSAVINPWVKPMMISISNQENVTSQPARKESTAKEKAPKQSNYFTHWLKHYHAPSVIPE